MKLEILEVGAAFFTVVHEVPVLIDGEEAAPYQYIETYPIEQYQQFLQVFNLAASEGASLLC